MATVAWRHAKAVGINSGGQSAATKARLVTRQYLANEISASHGGISAAASISKGSAAEICIDGDINRGVATWQSTKKIGAGPVNRLGLGNQKTTLTHRK